MNEYDGRVRPQSVINALSGALDYFASFVPAGVSLADAVIDERDNKAADDLSCDGETLFRALDVKV